MVGRLRRRGISCPRLLAAMGRLPRQLFVPPRERHRAHADAALPIGCGQTISQSFMVAQALAALQLGGTERVLEVGAGSGYAAALLSLLARRVIAVEIIAELADRAAEILRRLGCAGNVTVVAADGRDGHPAQAPYDAILVSAAAPEVPPGLLAQLAPLGRLVMPLAGRHGQVLTRIRRQPDGAICSEKLCACSFVPLVGGWR